MFRILHTADWHIGKTLAGYDRTAEFEQFFERLVGAVEAERPDAMIVAGDVFDTAMPSNSAANMYYRVIETLHSRYPALRIAITTGNHDSPSYLNAPRDVLHYFNVDVVGSVPRDSGGRVRFSDLVLDYGGALVCAVPYLRRGDLMDHGGNYGTVADLYRNVLDEAVRVRGGRDIPIIGVGHLTTIGATYNKGVGKSIVATRDDSVGGIDNIDPGDFPVDFSYIALGHIHRRQKAGDRGNIWYSGSPVPFSFSEKDYDHSLSVVDFDGGRLSGIRTIPLPHVVSLRHVPDELADFEAVSRALAELPDDEEMFIEVNLRPEFRSPDIKARIINELLKGKKAKFCGFRLVDLSGRAGADGIVGGETISVEQIQAMDPMSVIGDIYRNHANAELSGIHADMLRTVLEEIHTNV